MKFVDVKEALIKGQKVSRKNWGTGSTIFFLQIEEMFIGKVPEPDDFLELHMKTDDDNHTVSKWSLTDIEKEYDDWYILPEEKKEELLKGWECPRCKTIHSPYIETCTCKPEKDEIKEKKEECIHHWLLYNINYTVKGIEYTHVCKYCHAFGISSVPFPLFFGSSIL